MVRLSVFFLLIPNLASAASFAEKLAGLATQSDVTLVPPVGEPSPPLGSFVQLYAPADGQEPDPKRVGTYEVATSSCSEHLVFKGVDAAEKRSELWMVDTGIGLSLGLGNFAIGAGYGNKSLAGLEYDVSEKHVLDTGMAELEACCLKSPEACTDRYISEYWRGTGQLHKMSSSGAVIKATVKQIEKAGALEFGNAKGWSMASTWDEPMYFAYRVQSFKKPSCKSYMDNLPEVEGKVLFSGVSAKTDSEQSARSNARDDARRQLVEYLGTNYKIEGEDAQKQAEALVKGIKDSLVCMDDAEQTSDGPQYLSRVRMYVDSEAVEKAMGDMESKTE